MSSTDHGATGYVCVVVYVCACRLEGAHAQAHRHWSRLCRLEPLPFVREVPLAALLPIVDVVQLREALLRFADKPVAIDVVPSPR